LRFFPREPRPEASALPAVALTVVAAAAAVVVTAAAVVAAPAAVVAGAAAVVAAAVVAPAAVVDDVVFELLLQPVPTRTTDAAMVISRVDVRMKLSPVWMDSGAASQ
jgi:hypothetical protein